MANAVAGQHDPGIRTIEFRGIDLCSSEFRDKVYGGWAGKNIGGTLGGPLEGRKELMNYDFYPKLPDGPLANDDLDLQLVWLHALETYGPRLGAVELADEWKEHVFFPYDEYGFALTNMRKGLRPPVSGWFDNPFVDCMGAPIRSEIWAMVCPGEPELAAYYAYQDAITDHAGGEGVWGEMFFAAVESAAFAASNRDELIEIGLTVIPEASRVAQAVRDTLAWYKQGLDWKACREKILERHGRSNFTDAPQNVAFTILGWLYGTDFGDAICKAVNCGYDTDCTGATLGAILGILHGFEALPSRWKQPLGDRVVVSPAVRGFPAPATLAELTERTLRAAREVQAYWSGRPRPEIESLWHRRPQSTIYWIPKNTHASPGLEVTVDYGDDGPWAYPGEEVRLTLEIRNRSSDEWEGRILFLPPDGWEGDREIPYTLQPGETRQASVSFKVPPASSDPGENPDQESGPLAEPKDDGRRCVGQRHVTDRNCRGTSWNDDLPVYQVHMQVERYHNGFLWTTQHEELCFVRGARWEIESPSGETKTVVVPAGRIDIGRVFSQASSLRASSPRASSQQASPALEEGVYRLRTTLRIPTSRKARLVLGTGNPVRVLLDGRCVLDDPNSADPTTAPAYHRGRAVEVELSQGAHAVEIELKHTGTEPPALHFSLVATRGGKHPGPYSSYIDAIVG